MLQMPEALQDRVAGPVRVAAIYSVGLMHMEHVVQRFDELYPDARLRLEYLHPDEVYEQVLADDADLGLVSYPRHGGDIVSVDWQEQPMVLVVPPGHRLAGRRNIPVSELDGEDYVGFTEELTIRREVDRQLKRSRVAVRMVHEFDNIETIKRAIRRLSAGETALASAWPEPPSDLTPCTRDPFLRSQYLTGVTDRLTQIDEALGSSSDPVDAIADVPTSSVALAVSQVTRDKNKVFLVSGAASSDRCPAPTHRGAIRRTSPMASRTPP